MFASTDVRRCRNMKRSLWFPLVVLLVAQIYCCRATQQKVPQFIDANRFDDAVTTLFPVNVVRQFAKTRPGDATSDTWPRCSKQVGLLREGLRNSSSWALEMIDAASKIPSGMLMGNQQDLGMYDECVAVDVVVDGENIRGRHCMYQVLASIKATGFFESLSICMPAACEPDDIQQVLKDAIPALAAQIGVNLDVVRVTCSPVNPPNWTAGAIVTVVGFIVLLLVLGVCTVIDITLMYSNNQEAGRRLDAIRQFSLMANARRVLSTTAPSSKMLPAIQGLRFFSMCWVILGHEYYMYANAPVVNLKDVYQWLYSWRSIHILIAPFAVDTFFTISGFLMSYLFLKEMSTGRSFNIFAYYIHRYLRLTPAFVALILITIFILPRTGSGALWDTSYDEEICRKSWWAMLLYVHNYVHDGCLGHTWYLSVEMQLFWLSPIVLYPLARKPKLGLAILAACFVASIVVPCKIAYDNKYTSALVPNGDIRETTRTLKYFYRKSHNRAAPWLIGVFFGYLVFHQNGPSKKTFKWIGSLLAVVGFAFCFFSMRRFQKDGYVYEAVWETFYALVARPWWAFSIAWVIYACVRGFGGPITWFLSFSIFHPLSRLSYCVYLVHYVIILTKVRTVRMTRYFSDFAGFDYFLSDLMLSLIIAFLFSLVFESPVLVIERLVRKGSRKNPVVFRKESKGRADVYDNPNGLTVL